MEVATDMAGSVSDRVAMDPYIYNLNGVNAKLFGVDNLATSYWDYGICVWRFFRGGC